MDVTMGTPSGGGTLLGNPTMALSYCVWVFCWLVFLEERLTANQYKVVQSNHLYPMMKYFLYSKISFNFSPIRMPKEQV